MSRIGKLPIQIPAKVKVELKGRFVAVDGPKGKLTIQLPRLTSARIENGDVIVSRNCEDPEARSMHGLGRALINNMIKGVSDGFSKRLEITGVGFKASVAGRVVTLNLGFSHLINYKFPDQIKVTVEDSTKILIEGPDRQAVGLVAAEIRSFYPPEPYKGKGVKYDDERIERKEGKTVQ